jgi:hypothetical protein
VPQRAASQRAASCAASCTALQSAAEPEAIGAAVIPSAGSDVHPGLSAYSGHWPMFIGRGLRCLRCFAKPSGDYRVWKRGRCLELKPLHSMPGDMVSDVLRAGPPGVGAPTGMVSRHAALVECARRMPAVNRLARAAVRRACTFTFRQAGSGDATPVEPGGVPPRGGLWQAGPSGVGAGTSPPTGRSLTRPRR